MEEGDSHLRLVNLENIGVSQMMSTIRIKTSAKNSILTVKRSKTNKMGLKTALKASSSQIIQTQAAKRKSHVDNLKTELIKQVRWQKEWVTTSEHQFQRRLQQRQHSKVYNRARQARNLTIVSQSLHSQQKLGIHQRIQIKQIKIHSWFCPILENTDVHISLQLQMVTESMANWCLSMSRPFWPRRLSKASSIHLTRQKSISELLTQQKLKSN